MRDETCDDCRAVTSGDCGGHNTAAAIIARLEAELRDARDRARDDMQAWVSRWPPEKRGGWPDARVERDALRARVVALEAVGRAFLLAHMPDHDRDRCPMPGNCAGCAFRAALAANPCARAEEVAP